MSLWLRSGRCSSQRGRPAQFGNPHDDVTPIQAALMESFQQPEPLRQAVPTGAGLVWSTNAKSLILND
jgi:hypothetical protein